MTITDRGDFIRDIDHNKLMYGKRILIMGVANNWSLAWHAAHACANFGAEIIFAYQDEKLRSRVDKLAMEIGMGDNLIECNVEKDGAISDMFGIIDAKWGKIDGILHSIAFSDKNELDGRYIDTTLKNFLHTMHVSCYSFVEVARHGSKILSSGSSIVAMSYYGAEKAIPHYNVMGVAKSALESSVRYAACDLGPNNIRVNAVSAGPVKTLASSAIKGISKMLHATKAISPLRRNVTAQEVGNAVMYLLSDLSSGITGEILHVDCGYNVVGMPSPDSEQNDD